MVEIIQTLSSDPEMLKQFFNTIIVCIIGSSLPIAAIAAGISIIIGACRIQKKEESVKENNSNQTLSTESTGQES
jgi:hypothetical protein